MARVRQQIERHVLETSTVEESHGVAAHPPASLRYADYQLERLIGAGGMGKVYRAYERTTGTTVALKSLHKSHAFRPQVIRQFLQEGEILARLRHPNIVSLRGLGTFPSGAYFMVMDHIEGTDLQRYLHQQGRLSAPAALAIIRQVASAVAFAHSQGIVHCDLKPANVLVTPDNHVFVSDFGFACVVAEARRDAPFRWGGTIGYLAPECFEQGATPTPATDIYSLGVLLSVLLTGRPPTSDAVFHDEPELAVLRDAIARCLSREPHRRFADVASFLAVLPVH
jgi:serine/threonine-protein kinase